jgi:hypothetical protein
MGFHCARRWARASATEESRIATEYWLSDVFGVGLTAALSGATMLFNGETSARSIAIVAALRTAARRHYFIFDVSAGYARGQQSPGVGDCSYARSPDCLSHFHGFTIGGALGWLSHPGGETFEIGPVARLDVIADPRGRMPADYYLTMNLEFGLAAFDN